MLTLSLFDGMSCAKIALDRLNKKTDYFASEIDKYAIQVSQSRNPNIKHIGDVTKVSGTQFKGLDLLVGGSPCQDLTLAGNKKGLTGEKSKLFFEYVRIMNECKPKHFLLENVGSMTKENRNAMTSYMGVEPIMIDAALVTAQRRKRYFWTNIPGITMPADKGLVLKDILQKLTPQEEVDIELSQTHYNAFLKSYPTWKPSDINKKSKTLMASYFKQPPHSPYVPSTVTESGYRRLTPIECERLQGVDDDYTLGVSNSQRYKMLGNGFAVPVIEHIFSFIK